jgi:hypothetical protein
VSQEAEAVEGVEGKEGQPEVESDASEGREPKNENTNVYQNTVTLDYNKLG